MYNWLKYKTTTPSVLFKNRLFIERDSKHKRIFNNVGLTFRNLKWNSYESENTQPVFKSQYFKIISFIIICVGLVLLLNNFYNYYTLSYFYNEIFFCVWAGLDTFDYYFTFLVWIAFLIASMVTNLFQSYFFFNNLNSKSGKHKPEKFTNVLNHKACSAVNLSKKDYKFFLLNWLNSESLSQNPVLFENLKTLFVTNFNNDWWHKNCTFFLKLYKLTHLLKLSDKTGSAFAFQLKLARFELNNSFDLLTYLNASNLLNSNPTLFFSYLLKNQNNRHTFDFKKKTSVTFLANRTFWNPNYVFNTDQSDLNLFFRVDGFFYFSSTSSSQLTNLFKKNKNLNLLDSLVHNQINSAKWNRWLYKYSILHRKVFKNSHKLTLSKKLLNSGFYNSNLSKKNLWNSEFFSKSTNFNLLHFATSLLQPGVEVSPLFQTFSDSKAIYNFQHSQLSNLSVHETSFFWFLKRFYFFSNLGNNRIFSTTAVKKATCSYEIQNLSVHFNFQSFLLKSFGSNLKVLDLNSFYLNLTNTPQKLTILNKSAYLLFSDLDLFNRDNLEILNWVATPYSFVQNTKTFVPFFLANNFSNPNGFRISKFYRNTKIKTSLQTLPLYNLIEASDNSYLRDLLHLLSFYSK